MKEKEIKNKADNLTFFLNFIDISKIRVLQLLNKETKKLKNIQNLKNSNLNLLNTIEERWFLKRGMTFFERDNIHTQKIRKNSSIYFVVDPQKIDIFSKNMLAKMEETLFNKVTKDDYIVTFGSHVNIICQKLELNVIEHFDYSSYENTEELSEKMSSLIEIGAKNNLFNKAIIMIAQASNSHSDPIIQKQLLPFENYVTPTIEEKSLESEELSSDPENSALLSYKKIISSINIGKAQWNPDIFFFHEQFAKTIIKQIIHEIKVISNVEHFNLELQLLEEKKHKLTDQQQELKMFYNRVRKEESTMQSLLLFSAFKLREEEEEFQLVKFKGTVT